MKTNNKPTNIALEPDAIDSCPSEGPIKLVWTAWIGASSSPALNTDAIFFASCSSKIYLVL